jgi:hypothetical protein
VTEFRIVAIALVGVLATARLTRLLVADMYPPSIWVRIQWHHFTRDGGWAKLVDCHFCAAPYFAALVFGVGYFLHWPTWWWVATCWLAASYAAALVVERDEAD